MVYDNDSCLVAKTETDGRRRRTQMFTEMLSHYLFEDRYGRPGKGNDKGNVEGLVGWSRCNLMVPLPEFPDIESFNAWLEELYTRISGICCTRIENRKNVQFVELPENDTSSHGRFR